MSFDTPLLITFLVYLLLILCLGVKAYRRTHSLGDYILGGRKLGSVVTALSVGASDMSGWLLLGLPDLVTAASFIFLFMHWLPCRPFDTDTILPLVTHAIFES